MWSLLQSPIAMKLTIVLLHFGWQAILLLCAWRLASALMPQKSANARYNGALATLCLMLLCPILTFLAIDTWSLPQREPVLPVAVGLMPSGELTASSEFPGEAEELAASTPQSVLAESTIAATSSLSSANSLLLTYQPYLILLWLGGVMLLGLRICLSYLGTVWLRNVGLTLVDADVLVRFSNIARQLGVIHLPPIAFSDRISQAMTVGLMRPMVLLPVAWMTEISPEVLEAVLAHELAHVRRSDLWINFLQRVAETIFFYHPAVWLLSTEIRQHRESCCDELAVEATGQRLDYARSLQAVAHWQLAHRSPSLAAGFLGQHRGELIARVRYILGVTPPQAGERSWPAGLILVIVPLAFWAASAVVFPQIGLQAQAKETSFEEPNEEEEGIEPVVVPHRHPPHPPGFPPPRFGPPPRDGHGPLDGRPPMGGAPAHPPHRHPPRLPRPEDQGFVPRPGSPPHDDELPSNDQLVRRAMRAMRLELQDLREEVERLKEDQEAYPPARRRIPPRLRGGWSNDGPADTAEDSDF